MLAVNSSRISQISARGEKVQNLAYLLNAEMLKGYHSRVNRKPFKALLFAVRFKFVLNIVIKYSFKHYST